MMRINLISSRCPTLAQQSKALVRGIFTEACFSKKETVSNYFTLAQQSKALVRGIFTEACFSKKETVR